MYLRYPYSANMNPPINLVEIQAVFQQPCLCSCFRFNFSKDKRSENQKNCVNNLQEKKEAIGEIDKHRLTDIICILTISKIKLVAVMLPNVHLRYSD